MSSSTPWNRIEEDFRSYLVKSGISKEEFNGASMKERTDLMNNFQQPRQEQSFYYVVGSISRPVDHAGARYSLLRFASSEGLYPKGDDATTCKPAFETFASRKTGGRSVLKFALVFPSINSAAKFIDNVVTYLKQSREMLYFCDDEGNKVDEMPSMKAIASYPIAPQHKILLAHYVPSGQDTDAPDSPMIDVLFETRSMSEDATAYVTMLSKRDEVFLYQRIEAGNAFALADPESAHIFPSAKCIGQYEWLDDKPFNRLALSRDLHLNFDGTGRGRGKRRKTVQTLAMRPLRKPGGYAVVRIEDVDCYEIPLEIVINDNTKAAHVLARLPNHAQLNRKENAHWTITGADVRVHYPRNRRVTLIAEIENDFSSQKEIQLVTAIPGVRNLSDCWSNSPEARLSVEAAEILEKCLLWNYEAALSMWSSLG